MASGHASRNQRRNGSVSTNRGEHRRPEDCVQYVYIDHINIYIQNINIYIYYIQILKEEKSLCTEEEKRGCRPPTLAELERLWGRTGCDGGGCAFPALRHCPGECSSGLPVPMHLSSVYSWLFVCLFVCFKGKNWSKCPSPSLPEGT